MPAGGIAPQPDPLGIDAEVRALCPRELDRGFQVVHGARILGQERPPIFVGSGTAILPSAAMHGDDERRLGYALRQIEVARELCAAMLGVFDIAAGHDLILGLARVEGQSHRRCRKRDRKPGFHGTPPVCVVTVVVGRISAGEVVGCACCAAPRVIRRQLRMAGYGAPESAAPADRDGTARLILLSHISLTNCYWESSSWRG